MDTYMYLFPYEKIPHGARIVIYGAGVVGQEYLRQLLITHYADVVCFLDRAYDKYPPMGVPVYPPEKIKELKFDYIVLAFREGNFAKDVTRLLTEQGFPEDIMIFEGARNTSIHIESSDSVGHNSLQSDELAFHHAPLSIALKYGSGLGDAIIKKRLFWEIAKMAPEAKIDIYAPGGGGDFIPLLYCDHPQFNRAIGDGGALYAAYHKKYSLAMSVFYMIQTDFMDYDHVADVNPAFAEQMKRHIANHKAYRLNNFPATQKRVHFDRSFYRGWNCYSLYNYTDVFHISDWKVPIPLNPAYEKEYKEIGLPQYITFNFGNSITSKGRKQEANKQWPQEYFEQFIQLFHEKYTDIAVVQVGDNSTEKLAGADYYIIGKHLELVKYILKGALFHLDIEGGLMHLASQLGTKCVVIFGPTPVWLFGYPGNLNIDSPFCNGCYCIDDVNTYGCAKGLNRPECMWSITPAMVMERVEEFLKAI